MNVHECPFCHHMYSGQVCGYCSPQAPDIEQEKHMTAYIKNLKHNITRVFGRNPKKFKMSDADEDFIKVKEKMYKDMMNLQPTHWKNTTVVEEFLEQEKRLEEENSLEQEKPSLKVFEISVWEYGPPPIGRVMPRRELKDVIIMLSENFDSVSEQVNKEFAYYKNSDMDVVIKEVEGPFKSGSVLSSWDTK